MYTCLLPSFATPGGRGTGFADGDAGATHCPGTLAAEAAAAPAAGTLVAAALAVPPTSGVVAGAPGEGEAHVCVAVSAAVGVSTSVRQFKMLTMSPSYCG